MNYDAIIIGGGPAGSSAGAVLARKNHKVLLLEKDTFPRYHIGESLLPYSYFLFSEMGILDELKKHDFVKKYSVKFVSQNGKQSLPFYFQQHFSHEAAQTWQVDRASFDKLLLDNAIKQGVSVQQQTEAIQLLKNESGRVTGVSAKDKNNEIKNYYAPVVIDASGRQGFATSQNRWRRMDKELKKIAIWSYFEGAKRESGQDEGATTVAYAGGKNWFWYIPLKENIISVGIVGEKKDLYANSRELRSVFNEMVAKNSWISQNLAGSRRMKAYQLTGDYSYRSLHCASDGLVLVGDAFAFLDPVFSSGVFLALYSGVHAAKAIHEILPQEINAQHFNKYGSIVCHAIDVMRKLVYAFYDPDFSFNVFFKQYPHLKHRITDGLIGNFSEDFTELFIAMNEFFPLPDNLDYGAPNVASHTLSLI